MSQNTSKKQRIFSRIGEIGSQVFTSAASMRSEIEAVTTERLERLARRLHLVRRDEFESLQAMVKEARNAQEELRARLDRFEGKGKKEVKTSLKASRKSLNKRRAKSVS